MPRPEVITIAIDGPAAAGKSTVSKALAVELGLALVDTGALYRSVALAAKRRSVAWDDDAGLERLVADLEVRFEFDGSTNRVFLGDEDVSAAIRTPDISGGASRVSARPVVRAGLLVVQRSLANRPPGAVMEGRDIGTVVLPGATVKFFLTASPEVRAGRRHAERLSCGEEVTFEEVLAAERERDRRDSTRAIAPLKQADDAILVDSSGLSTDEVIRQMAGVVRTRVAGLQ